MNTYCIFCKGGRESVVIPRLEALGHATIAPFARQLFLKKESRTTKLKRLIPGYVFFDSENEPDWPRVLRIPDVSRRLEYRNGEYALRPADLAFVDWLKHFGGVIEVSRAIQVGTRLQFIDGPLKAMAGNICAVNKKRNVAAIRFGDEESLLGTIWCSLEVIAKYADLQSANVTPMAAG